MSRSPKGEPPADAATFMAATDAITALRTDLTRLEAGLLAGLHLHLASDTRGFARVFGVEHALVLRALDSLVNQAGLLVVIERNERTQRTRYAATEDGQAVLRGLAA